MSSDYLARLDKTVKQAHDWRTKECLNLIPSENRGSQRMRSMFLADLGGRYNAPDRYYKGTKYADEVLSITEELARKLFRARYADVKSLSGHTADMAVLLSLTKPKDRIVSVHPEKGGYPGISHLGVGPLLGLENQYFAYDDRAVNIDAKGSSAMLESNEARVVFFGASFIPFPHPIGQLSKLADGVCVYDGSHVLGLIAGGEFQDPLREGCSILIASTHKSFPGPQGGIILANDDTAFSSVAGKIFPGIVDNIHLDRVAALAIALIEMLQFGKAYAQEILKNSHALAKSLDDQGIRLRGKDFGFTKSHQILLDYDESRLQLVATRLEQANIIVDIGGRIGTAELTRMGYGPGEMETVAELVAMIINGKKPPEFVQKRVKSLVREFQHPKFALTSVPKLFD